MSKICPTYAADMSSKKVCLKYANDSTNVCSRYIKDMGHSTKKCTEGSYWGYLLKIIE